MAAVMKRKTKKPSAETLETADESGMTDRMKKNIQLAKVAEEKTLDDALGLIAEFICGIGEEDDRWLEFFIKNLHYNATSAGNQLAVANSSINGLAQLIASAGVEVHETKEGTWIAIRKAGDDVISTGPTRDAAIGGLIGKLNGR